MNDDIDSADEVIGVGGTNRDEGDVLNDDVDSDDEVSDCDRKNADGNDVEDDAPSRLNVDVVDPAEDATGISKFASVSCIAALICSCCPEANYEEIDENEDIFFGNNADIIGVSGMVSYTTIKRCLGTF